MLHSVLIAGCSERVGLVKEDYVRDRGYHKSEQEEKRGSSC